MVYSVLPLKAKYLCTVKKAIAITLALLFTNFILNGHWFFTIKPVSLNYVPNIDCDPGKEIQYQFFSIMFWFIPGIIIQSRIKVHFVATFSNNFFIVFVSVL